jgi:alkaline phosphatase
MREIRLAIVISTLMLALSASAEQTAARNVILMITDGVGFNGWMAADYYAGLAGEQPYQVERPDGTQPYLYGMTHWALNPINANGEILEKPELGDIDGVREQGYDPSTRWQAFENAFRNDFDPVGIEYSSYADSAAAGTTLQTGRKTVNGRINQDWQGRDLTTIAEVADTEGLATGSVSSVMASHATPATTWAHNVSRNNYGAIFREMVSGELDVVMGAGHPHYDSSGQRFELDKRNYQYVGGKDFWDRISGPDRFNGYTFIDNPEDFNKIARGEAVPEKLLGIARSNSTLQALREDMPSSADSLSGAAFVDNVPDLPTMSQAALNVLGQNDKGFFVMIEGGAPDWMAHANNMPRFIEEQLDFNRAVSSVIEWVENNSNWDETLLIVTSDHETGGIWGRGTYSNDKGGNVARSRDDQALEKARFHPDDDEFNKFSAVQNNGEGEMPGYQFASGNHTNEIVPLWVLGASAECFEDFTRHDFKPAELWGQSAPYGWDGTYVDNTAVFTIMKHVLTGRD